MDDKPLFSTTHTTMDRPHWFKRFLQWLGFFRPRFSDEAIERESNMKGISELASIVGEKQLVATYLNMGRMQISVITGEPFVSVENEDWFKKIYE